MDAGGASDPHSDSELAEKPSPPYDRGSTTRLLLLAGIVFTFAVGSVCTIAGLVLTVVLRSSSFADQGDALWLWKDDAVQGVDHSAFVTGASVSISLLVTIASTLTGMAHATALRWALAELGRLEFICNVRLFTRAGSAWGPTGLVANVVYGTALILAFATNSLCFFMAIGGDDDNPYSVPVVAPLPFLVLGLSLLIMAGITLWSVATVDIPTWSSHPLDVAAAMVERGFVSHRPGRCMTPLLAPEGPGWLYLRARSLLGWFLYEKQSGYGDPSSDSTRPRKPLVKQPPPLRAHRHVKWIVCGAWGLFVFQVLWNNLVLALRKLPRWDGVCWDRLRSNFGDPCDPGPVQVSLPNLWGDLSAVLPVYFVDAGEGAIRNDVLALSLFTVGAMQAAITLVLHACDLLVGMRSDEKAWREASTDTGARTDRNPVLAFLSHPKPETIGMLLWTTVYHWLFGQSFYTDGATIITMVDDPVRIGEIAAFLLATFVTIMATTDFAWFWRRGDWVFASPQPATFGHVQTLVDLVDEWASPRMYWGHKGTNQQNIGHAGTSSKSLPRVNMELYYGGDGSAVEAASPDERLSSL